jgi:citrate lyase beta subunit
MHLSYLLASSADAALAMRMPAARPATACAIESARGVLAAAEIATVDGVRHLSLGGVDLRRDLNADEGDLQTLYVRSHLVVVSRAAGLEPPIDSVYTPLDDESGAAGGGEIRALARLGSRLTRQPRRGPCPSPRTARDRRRRSGPRRLAA